MSTISIIGSGGMAAAIGGRTVKAGYTVEVVSRQPSDSDISTDSSSFVVWASLLGDLLVAGTKLAAALVTGSTALFSEAVHSFVDTGNELLLLWGIRRAELLPDEQFPLGHGREVYFWSFVVAMLVFALGAVVALLKGIAQITAPNAIERPKVIFIVLALSAPFEGASWIISLRVFRRTGARRSFWRALQGSKDPPKFMVLLEDSAALLGLAVAALGTWLAVSLNEPRFDGLASVLIGVLLTAVAFVLAAKTKDLLHYPVRPRSWLASRPRVGPCGRPRSRRSAPAASGRDRASRWVAAS